VWGLRSLPERLKPRLQRHKVRLRGLPAEASAREADVGLGIED
jgi:hypothetical protein